MTHKDTRRHRSLTELQDELQLLHQLPEMAAKLDEIHTIVTGGK